MRATCVFLLTCAALAPLLAVLADTRTSSCSPDELAVYRVFLDTHWSRELFPRQYPEWRPPAGWSKMVGRSHDSSYWLFREGELASAGLQVFAEKGQSDGLEAADHAGVYDEFTAPPIARGVGRTVADFFLDGNHTRVSVAVRVVPSPDWFIGVDSLDLCRGNNWIDSIAIEVDPMDAGTDNGFTFTAPNWPSEPKEPVTRITSQRPSHPANSFYYSKLDKLPSIATLTFVKCQLHEDNATVTATATTESSRCSTTNHTNAQGVTSAGTSIRAYNFTKETTLFRELVTDDSPTYRGNFSIPHTSIPNSNISNPSISNPSIPNSSIMNSSISNPSTSNSSISNPSIPNPSIPNSSIMNSSISNPSITNSSISNPSIPNSSITNSSISDPSIPNSSKTTSIGTAFNTTGVSPTTSPMLEGDIFDTEQCTATRNCSMARPVRDVQGQGTVKPIAPTAESTNANSDHLAGPNAAATTAGQPEGSTMALRGPAESPTSSTGHTTESEDGASPARMVARLRPTPGTATSRSPRRSQGKPTLAPRLECSCPEQIPGLTPTFAQTEIDDIDDLLEERVYHLSMEPSRNASRERERDLLDANEISNDLAPGPGFGLSLAPGLDSTESAIRRTSKARRSKKGSRQAKNCLVSEWSAWSACSVSCGVGDATRSRRVLEHPRRGGRPCPALQERRWCGGHSECPQNFFNW